jgi:para-nitrobenzyl esterase
MVAYSGPNAQFNGVSAAVIMGNQLWLGSYQADRVAHRTLVQPALSGDPVTTTSGQVAGVQLKSGVRAYLGIRYAAPPTQNLRWKPPQAIHWEGVWVADRKGAECIQVLRPHNINHYFGEEPTGEDCLYLNIWTPAGARRGSNLPVIVFLYGGGGTIGSSGMPLYDGDIVAAHGAVFVNLNYRVGALGFMAHPELTQEQGGTSGNYGYLDQNAALQWIHANIAAFGGDPSKVLLAGQSFGAGSVAAQMFSPLSKGLFRAAAMWSACNFTTSGPDLQTAEQAGLDLQHRLGAANLEEMRYAPADRILAQQTESQVGAKVQGVRTPPLIDGYFTVGPKDNVRGDVPIMVSSNGDDLDASMSPLTRAKTVQDYEAIARRLYGADAGKFLSLFPAGKDSQVYAEAHAAARESGMLKASRSCARKQAGSAAYISLFSHKHPYSPDVKFADQDPVTVGAYHSADIPYWLGTFEAFNVFRVTRAWTDYDRHLSDAMLQALIRFAATGSPDSAELKWPAWSARNEQYLSLGDEIAVTRLQAARMDWLAAHPAAAGESPPARTTPRD